MSLRPNLLLPFIALALAGCGGTIDKADPADERDPAVSGALGDPILIDPDLTSQNNTGALTGGGPAIAEIPAEKRTPEFIAAAKAEALKVAGGTFRIVPAAASEGRGTAPQSVGQLAAALPGKSPDCASQVEYTTAWATKLPAALPVYPRGHVQEASGTDKNGCSLRIVNFLTPVSVDDVLNFYYTSARTGGYDAEHRVEGGDHLLGGSKGAAAFVVYVRTLANGLTEVDLVSNGS